MAVGLVGTTYAAMQYTHADDQLGSTWAVRVDDILALANNLYSNSITVVSSVQTYDQRRPHMITAATKPTTSPATRP